MKPLFVVGCYRSGTSLLRLMLNAHSKISIPEETHYIPQFLDRAKVLNLQSEMEVRCFISDIIDYLALHSMWNKVPTVDSIYAALKHDFDVAKIFQEIAIFGERKQSSKYWGDKTPRYIDASACLADFFPDALFVEVVRDGRDVAASVYSEPMHGGMTVVQVAEDWYRKVSYGDDLAKIDKHRVLRVHYEDMVKSCPQVLEKICVFLDVEYEDSMMRFYETSEAISLARQGHHKNVVSPISCKSVGRYKDIMTEKDIATFEAICGSKLISLGYDVEARACLGINSRDKISSYPLHIFRYMRYQLHSRIKNFSNRLLYKLAKFRGKK